MLIKQADDRSEELAQLERAAGALKGEAAKRAGGELRQRKAGLQGEADSAYQIDFHFRESPKRAVIHDLRLEYNGRVAQIDHLIVNRRLDCYVLESKHFHTASKSRKKASSCVGTLTGAPLRAWNRHSSRTNATLPC